MNQAGSLHVAALYLHPVKSCAAVAVDVAQVTDRGFAHDRRFMIVDGAGRFLTQRQEPKLALLVPHLREEHAALALTAPRLSRGLGELRVPLAPAGPLARVEVWGDTVDAVDVGKEAAAWLERATGREGLRLVHMPESSRRPVDAVADGGLVSFADGFPYLVVGEASIAEVGARAPGTGDARRFRPNLVIAGLAPHEEDELFGLRLGAVELRFVKACSRCSVVGIDPDEATAGKQPLATLATYRTVGGQVMFGQNAVASGRGEVRINDLAERWLRPG